MSAGSYSRADLNAMMNVPITDTVFFRVQGATLNQDGYVRRGTQELGGSEDTIGRLQLALVPNENLRVTFAASMQSSESDGNPQDLATFDMNPNLNYQGGRADWLSDFLALAGQPRLDPNNDPRFVLDDFTMTDWCFLDDGNPDWDSSCEQTNESDYSQFSINANWQINQDWSLTSITGVSDFESEGRTDWVMIGTRVDPTNVESDVVYQELQLTADFGRVDLVTGVSFFGEDSSSVGAVHERRGTSIYNATGGLPGTPPDAVATSTFGPNGLFVTTDTAIDQTTSSYGVFANLAWHLTDRFTVTPGVRYGYDEKEVTQVRFAADDFIPFSGACRRRSSRRTIGTIPTIGSRWTISSPTTTWCISRPRRRTGPAHIATAWPGCTGAGPPPPVSGERRRKPSPMGSSQAFTPPESVQNNELGFRTEWLDQRLRLNITYFDMAYSDRQGPIQIRGSLRRRRVSGSRPSTPATWISTASSSRARSPRPRGSRSTSPQARSIRSSKTRAQTTAISCSRARSRRATRWVAAGRCRCNEAAISR